MDVLTTTQAAKELGISRVRIVAMIGAGRLKAEKMGRDWMIQRADLAPVRKRKPGRPKNPTKKG
jgi:excisionase family DNA binding protein